MRADASPPLRFDADLALGNNPHSHNGGDSCSHRILKGRREDGGAQDPDAEGCEFGGGVGGCGSLFFALRTLPPFETRGKRSDLV